jgi:hypothetical protein
MMPGHVRQCITYSDHFNFRICQNLIAIGYIKSMTTLCLHAIRKIIIKMALRILTCLPSLLCVVLMQDYHG